MTASRPRLRSPLSHSRRIWSILQEAGRCQQPAEKFKRLYRYTFDYLTRTKHLNNLLWVYDAVDKKRHALNLSHCPGDAYVDIVGVTMNWDSGPVGQPTSPCPTKVLGCVEFNVPFDRKKHPCLDITRDYDYRPKFRWMRDNLPSASFFMSWDRLSGPLCPRHPGRCARHVQRPGSGESSRHRLESNLPSASRRGKAMIPRGPVARHAPGWS